MRRLLTFTLASLVVPVFAAAQQGAPAKPDAPAAAGQVAPATKTPGVVPLEPQGYDYDPEGRRDPFVSLVRRGADATASAPGSRAAGLAGLETAEVALKGTLQSHDGFVGILEGSDNRTYIVRVGDRLVDGSIRTITQNTLVILQQVNDPLSRDRLREVRKTIRGADEAK